MQTISARFDQFVELFKLELNPEPGRIFQRRRPVLV
jgi:hypothetical protein